MRIVRIVAVALFVLAVAALAGVGRPEAIHSAQTDEPAARTVTVGGTASVTAVPDRATFTFGVETRGQTASQALSASGRAIQRVVDAVRRAGIDAKEIQTQQISLYPQTSSDGRHIEGYAAGSSVTVKLGNLDRAGALVDAAVGAGANSVSGPALARSDADELRAHALADAVTDARAKAEVLARAAGGSLGDVVSVVEGGTSVSPPVPFAREAMAADVRIEPGTQDIQASVTVTFELRS